MRGAMVHEEENAYHQDCNYIGRQNQVFPPEKKKICLQPMNQQSMNISVPSYQSLKTKLASLFWGNENKFKTWTNKKQ